MPNENPHGPAEDNPIEQPTPRDPEHPVHDPAVTGDDGTETDAEQTSAGAAAEHLRVGEEEIFYQRTATGHRVTRRKVTRHESSEETAETITDTYPVPYQAPATPQHPAPVG